MKLKITYIIIVIAAIILIGCVYGWGWSWLGLFTSFLPPIWSLAKASWKRGREAVQHLKERRKQSRNPSEFLDLIIDRVNFNPKAYEEAEQDYLELDLSIISRLFVGLTLHRLSGQLSIDGSEPPDVFEVCESVTLHGSGNTDKNKWCDVIVKLSCSTKNYLHRMREKGNDVRVLVQLKGSRNGETPINIEKSTNKLSVPKLR